MAKIEGFDVTISQYLNNKKFGSFTIYVFASNEKDAEELALKKAWEENDYEFDDFKILEMKPVYF